MPGKDERGGAPGARPAPGDGHSRGGSAKDVSYGGSDENKPLPASGRDGLRGGTAAHGQDRGGRTALGKQTIIGAIDQHDVAAGGPPFQPPAILRAPSSLLSHPLFLHPVAQLSAPFRAPSIPPFVPAPLLFPPLVGAPRPSSPADSAAAQTQTPAAPQPAEVPSPKVELSATSSAIATVPTQVETPSSAITVSVSASSAPSPESAIASTTSAPAPDISPIAAPQVDSSFTTPDTSDILPVTNTGGKVAAACVIGAVFLLLLNWAFWLVIRRRRRARRSMPAHWDFAAPPAVKGDAGRDSEEDEWDAGRDVKGGMVTVPV